MRIYKEHGFNIIELMVITMITGVLALYAYPQYNVYITKSKVAELVDFGNSVKQNIINYSEYHDAWPTSLADIGSPNASYIQAIGFNVNADSLLLDIEINPDDLGLPADEKMLAIRLDFIGNAYTAECGWKESSRGYYISELYLPKNCQSINLNNN